MRYFVEKDYEKNYALFMRIMKKVFIFFSYDGIPEIQNKYRISKSGELTYSLIYEKISSFIKSRSELLADDNMAVRMTVTNDFIPKLTEAYIKLRDELHCQKISFALVSADKSKEYAIAKKDLPILREQYLKLAELYLEEIQQGESHNRFFESLVRNVSNGFKKNFFCDCGNRYVTISAEGNIYPCEGFLGYEKEFLLGNSYSKKIKQINKGIESVEEVDACRSCWAKYLCGGSCYHECYMRNGSVNKKDELMCETYKIAIEVGISIYIQLKNRGLLETFHKLTLEQIADNVCPILDMENVKIFDNSNILFASTNDSYRILELDEMTKYFLDLCNGNNTISEIVDNISSEYDGNKKIIYKDVNEMIHRFKNLSIMYLTN